MSITFPTVGSDFNFFPLGDFARCHSSDCHLVFGSKWRSLVSPPVTILATVISNILILCQAFTAHRFSAFFVRMSSSSELNLHAFSQPQHATFCTHLLHQLPVRTNVSFTVTHLSSETTPFTRCTLPGVYAVCVESRVLACPHPPDSLRAHRLTTLRTTASLPYAFLILL